MMRTMLSLIFAVILLGFYTITSSYDCQSDDKTQTLSLREESATTDCFISQKLRQNTDLMRNVNGGKNNGSIDINSSVELTIHNDLCKVDMCLNYQGSIRKVTLSGDYERIATENETGYIGVYNGFIPTISSRNLCISKDGLLPVTANIVFTNHEMKASLTLGYAGENIDPDILYYGDDTETLNAILCAKIERKLMKETTRDDIGGDDGGGIPSPTVDGTCRYKGSANGYQQSYLVSNLSVFHANELRNQGLMSVYAKLNTSSASVLNYIKNHLRFDTAILVYPEQFSISICGNHNDFHAVTNSYTPQNNSTSAPLNIPFYLGSTLGVQWITLNITMTSTTVTPSRYSSDSPHPNNRLTWDIYKRNGWSPTEMDGNYTTSKGMTAAASYTYEGNVNSVLARSLTSTGTICYEFYGYWGPTPYWHSFWTNPISKTTSVAIKP